MPETTGNETPVSPTTRKRNERTEAKFFEDVEKIVAEAERLGAEYTPPNDIAKLDQSENKTRRDTCRPHCQSGKRSRRGKRAQQPRKSFQNIKQRHYKPCRLRQISRKSRKRSRRFAVNRPRCQRRTRRSDQSERHRKAHLGCQSVLRYPRRQLFPFYRTIRRARNPDDRRPIQSRDAPHQTSRTRRRQQFGHHIGSQFKHIGRTTRQTGIHRRRQPDKRLPLGKSLHQIKIRHKRTTISKHRQNALRTADAIAEEKVNR